MQNPGPEVPPTYQAPGAQPPRRSSAWVWWLAGCGGCGCLVVVALVALLVTVIRAPKQPPPVSYVGQWVGDDGTSLEIASDGTGGYRKGGNSIQGGRVAVDEPGRTLGVSLGPIRKTWAITSPPHPVAGSSQMQLDHITFRRGGDTAGGGATEGATGALSVPSEAELKELTTLTLLQLSQAVRSGDYASFIQQAATPFQEQLTPAKLQRSFRQFADRGIDLGAVRTAPEHFEPAPTIDKNGLLDVAGYYDTAPQKVRFHLWYAKEGPSWKLMQIQVSTR